jgi:hypothetical protein
MRDGSKLLRYTFLALLVVPIAIGYASTTQVIAMQPAAKAVPTIKWGEATTISDGTALASVLNASGGVAGSFSYTAAPTGGPAVAVTADTMLAAGDYTITAIFTPLDQAHYRSVTAIVPITVNPEITDNFASR